MYETVFSNLGFTTFSRAFTLRLVVLIASSNVKKEVCNDASSTRTSTAFANADLQSWTCCPPRANPVRSVLSSAASRNGSNFGSFTPATLSCLAFTLIIALPTFSNTMCLMFSPAAYFASTSENMDAFISPPIDSLASTIRFKMCRNCMVSASLFFFNS
jgi:hypothetical protein